MGCIHCKSTKVKNSIQPTSKEDLQPTYVEIIDITDLCESPVEYIAAVDMAAHSVQPSLLESPFPAETEEKPGSSHNTGGAISLHEPESFESAVTENRDCASPITFNWFSFDAKVGIPVLTDIAERLMDICQTDEPSEKPALFGSEVDKENETNSSSTYHSFPSVPRDLESESDSMEEIEEIEGAEAPSASLVQAAAPVLMENFNLGKVLGTGGFGKVFLAEHKETRRLCAIKALKKEDIVDKGNFESVLKEKKILEKITSVKDPFLVSLHGSFQTENHLFFVMEYLPGGDLFDLSEAIGQLEEPQVRFYAACVVLGLEALHRIGIVHRDLKLENLMLDKDGYVKIVDFGLSKDRFGFGQRTQTQCGTIPYMAPEIFLGNGYGMAVDWWALGIMIYILLTDELPFENEDMNELIRSILYYEPPLPAELSMFVRNLIGELLKKDPESRLGFGHFGAERVKEHAFFSFIEWDAVLNRSMRPPFLLDNQGHLESLKDPECQALTLTPPARKIPSEMQEEFREFDYTAD